MSNYDHLKDPVVQTVVKQNLKIALRRLELALGGKPPMSGSRTITIGVQPEPQGPCPTEPVPGLPI